MKNSSTKSLATAIQPTKLVVSKGTVKKFRQVSFPAGFMEVMQVLADADGRSLAQQIVHYASIGQKIEGTLPATDLVRIKQGIPLVEVLKQWDVDFAKRTMSPAESEDWVKKERAFAAAQSEAFQGSGNLSSSVTTVLAPKGKKRAPDPIKPKTGSQRTRKGATSESLAV